MHDAQYNVDNYFKYFIELIYHILNKISLFICYQLYRKGGSLKFCNSEMLQNIEFAKVVITSLY